MSPERLHPDILAITDAFSPLKGGGTAYTYNAILGLPFRVLALCPFRSERHAGSLCVKRVFYTNFQIRNKYARKVYSVYLYLQLALIPLFWAIRHRRHLRLVVCFQLLPTGIAGYLIHHLFGIPFAVVTYGEELAQALRKQLLGRNFHKWLMKLILSDAACIATISAYTRRILAHFDAEDDRVFLIPPGVANARPAGPTRNTLGLLHDHELVGSRIILMASRLIERKGFDCAIRVFSQMVQEDKRLRLVIVGTGDQEEFLKGLADTMTRPGEVVFLGELTDTDLHYLYSICEVFLLPVRALSNGDTEGFGMVFIEAGSYGKPVIGGRAGATPEAVVDGVTGLLVDGTSTDQIKSALWRILNDRDLAVRLGREGRRRAVEDFSIERQQEGFNRMIRTLIGPPRNQSVQLHD